MSAARTGTMLDNSDKLAFGKTEAARLLGIHPVYITRAVRNGELITRRIGARSKIWRDDLEAWFKTQPRPHTRTRKETTS